MTHIKTIIIGAYTMSHNSIKIKFFDIGFDTLWQKLPDRQYSNQDR
jgi:hypothetical protein